MVPHLAVFITGIVSLVANIYQSKVTITVNFTYLYLFMEAFLVQNLIIGVIMMGTIIKANKHEKIKLGRYD
jgi:hypothetical protein